MNRRVLGRDPFARTTIPAPAEPVASGTDAGQDRTEAARKDQHTPAKRGEGKRHRKRRARQKAKKVTGNESRATADATPVWPQRPMLSQAPLERVELVDAVQPPSQLPDFLRTALGKLEGLQLRWKSMQVDPFGYDEAFWERLQPLLQWLVEKWWKVQTEGLENVPSSGPVMLVANHGGILPWDGLVLRYCLTGANRSRDCRFLVEDDFVRMPFVGTWLARLGGVRACPENATRLLRDGAALVVFPEGMKGLGKPLANRYQLQRFGRGGFARLAGRLGVPMVPVAVVGAEETYPLIGRLDAPARKLGLPFLPITPTFPWLGPLGLVPMPSRWKVVFGKPVYFEGEITDESVMRTSEKVRDAIQNMLDIAQAGLTR